MNLQIDIRLRKSNSVCAGFLYIRVRQDLQFDSAHGRLQSPKLESIHHIADISKQVGWNPNIKTSALPLVRQSHTMSKLHNLSVIPLVILYVTAKHIVVFNQCSETIWPALHGRNNNSDFVSFRTPPLLGVSPNASFEFPLPNESFSGRLWGRTRCKSIAANSSSGAVGGFSCGTGDCGDLTCQKTTSSNTTLVEFSITNQKLYYDISLVDGMTKPVQVSLPSTNCKSLGCVKKVENFACPVQNRWHDPSGTLLGCKSNCSVWNTPKTCCTGQYNTTESCTVDSNPLFASVCPEAYSYAYSEIQRQVVLQICEEQFDNMLVKFCPTI